MKKFFGVDVMFNHKIEEHRRYPTLPQRYLLVQANEDGEIFWSPF